MEYIRIERPEQWAWGFSRVDNGLLKAFGYFPGVAKMNRDGNTPVKFCQAETLKRLFCIPAQTWAVHLPRADCGSYSKEIVETIDAHSNLFPASNCERLSEFAELGENH